MKFSFFTFLVLASCLCLQCSNRVISVKSESPTGSPNILASPAQRQSQGADYAALKSELRREEEKLGLNDLSTKVSDGAREIRICVGFGLLYPRCFILRNVAEKREAFYVGLSEVPDKSSTKDSERRATNRSVLKAPRSGWIKFEEFLTGQGIKFPMSFPTQITPDPDVEIMAIETKHEDLYSVVFSSLNTQTQDQPNLRHICLKIEEEFEITMGCN